MRLPYYAEMSGSARADIIWVRWGGGAHPGKTYVFSIGPYPWVFVSEQCVTDDFGNLVKVPS